MKLQIIGTEILTLSQANLYKSEYIGSGTFIITKPKRKKAKMRQTRLKNVKRGSRK
jgi:glycine betaine/choline ABC-type transport system substrate-binding protein